MPVYKLPDRIPQIDSAAYIAPGADVIGSVKLDANASIWFGVVLRADNDTIHIGKGSNIQDNTVLHADPGFPIEVGEHVTVGHSVMLHGCSIGDHSLIGIGSVILNGARIGKNCLIGANSLITEGKEFPEGSLILGSPAKVVRQLSTEELDSLRQAAAAYVDKSVRYQSLIEELPD